MSLGDAVMKCPACKGDRAVKCAKCAGWGLVPAPAFAVPLRRDPLPWMEHFREGRLPPGDVDAILDVTLGDELAAAGEEES